MKRVQLLLIVSLFSWHTFAQHEEQSPLYRGTYSDDFIIRWGFQDRCDHVFDIGKKWQTGGRPKVDPSNVKPGDTIFVRNALNFFKNVMPKINVPCIIVTAGELYDAVKPHHLPYLDNENIIAWFVIHPHEETHPKIHPIPLGVYQKDSYFKNRTWWSNYFAELRNSKKTGFLYMNFEGGNRPPYRADRNIVYNLLKKEKFCTKAHRRAFRKYVRQMATFKFALSPRGTAPDTYRTWEALLVGTIPVIKTSHMDPLYADLPVLIVNEWTDITKEFLEEKYQEICSKKYDIEKLFMAYWWNQIEEVRDMYRENGQGPADDLA